MAPIVSGTRAALQMKTTRATSTNAAKYSRAPKHLGDFTTSVRVLPISALACVIGVVCCFVAFGLLRMIGLFTNLFFYHRFSTAMVSPAGHHFGLASVMVPVAGGLVIGLMARFGSERIRGHGIPEAIESILLKGSCIEPRVALLKPISSAISIGSGGPFGAEGPIIMTGGAFGSMIGQLIHVTNAERKTLLVAGAAAGMSATFASPVAAALLAVELLLFEWKPRSFIPVALASAAAAIVRVPLLGEGPLFTVPHHEALRGATALGACVLCGVLAGALSALLTLSVYAFEDLFHRLPIHWMWWPALGGAVIGLGGLIHPQALGVGYDVIERLVQGHLLGVGLVTLLAVKWIIWSASLGSGTSGGVLAPLLIMGAALGGCEAHWFPNHGAGYWQVVSMGAILGGTMRSPFTGIIFVLELTHDIDLMLPLLLAVTCSHAFTVLLLKRSILTEKVSRRGHHLTREYEAEPTEIIFTHEVMASEVPQVSASGAHPFALTYVEPSDGRHPFVAVVDEAGCLLGTVAPLALAKWALGTDDLRAPIHSILRRTVTAHPDEPLRTVVNRMAAAGLTALPVVDRLAPGKLLGSIALSDTLKARERHLNEEHRRHRVLSFGKFVPGFIRTAARYRNPS